MVLPPKLAPVQVVVIPIWKSDSEHAAVMEAVHQVEATLRDEVRLRVDARDEYSPGWKFNEWEMRGAPLRIEIGPRDLAAGRATLARRDVPGREGKRNVPLDGVLAEVRQELATIQVDLYRRALDFRQAHTYEPQDYGEFKEAVANGFAYSWWCGDGDCEAQIGEDTKATTRCIPLEQEPGKGKCIHCGRDASERAIFGRAY